MTEQDLIEFRRWFSGYGKSFPMREMKDRKNIEMKEQHTSNVCKDILLVGRGSGLSKEELLIAETVALFHDIGRFPQYAQYKTFRDSLSVNHGELGVEILLESGILKRLSVHEQEIITQAVKFHNAFKIPKVIGHDAALFLKLIRDADKLDIWRVFIEHYATPGEDQASAVGFNAPDIAECSKEVLECFQKGQTVSLAQVKTLNDVKLLQLTWIFDINFPATLKIIRERDYIKRFSLYLPDTGEIREALDHLKEYIGRRLREGQ